MRRKSTLTGLGATLIATPAFAHVGDHGEQGAAHFMAEHGLAAGLAALAIVAAFGALYFIKRKG